MIRRTFLSTSAVALAALSNSMQLQATTDDNSHSKFTMDLCPGRIGVRADQRRTMELAHRFGFHSVEPMGAFLASLAANELSDLLGDLKEKQLRWGAASLDVNFRSDSAKFREDLQQLVTTAAGLQRAGVERVGTWITPSHQELTYMANFKQHTLRLREISKILRDHGIRFGLEYVGPKKSWTSKRFPFIHTLHETRELLDEIGAPNLGVVLDSWHWYTAGETVADLMQLSNQEIIAVDLNDAPIGIERDLQIDNRRELPMATGVIDLKGFMVALKNLDYDGPIRAEPFNKSLDALDDDEAVQQTATALKAALEL